LSSFQSLSGLTQATEKILEKKKKKKKEKRKKKKEKEKEV